jgi:hypothetical protein
MTTTAVKTGASVFTMLRRADPVSGSRPGPQTSALSPTAPTLDLASGHPSCWRSSCLRRCGLFSASMRGEFQRCCLNVDPVVRLDPPEDQQRL